MSTTFYAKRGEAKIVVAATLLDGNGAAVDLTGASIRLRLRPEGRQVLLYDIAGSVTSALTGSVSATLTSTHLQTRRRYEAEWVATWGDGTVEKFPKPGFFIIDVGEDAS